MLVPAGHHGDGLHAHQAEHEVVAAGVLVEAAGHALLDHEAAFQALLDRRGQRDAAMVGLRRAAGDHGVGALGQRVGHQEFELAGLVAAGEQAQHVVALDPDLGTLAAGAGGGQRGEEKRGSGSSGVTKGV
jgi:hypothetical protein